MTTYAIRGGEEGARRLDRRSIVAYPRIFQVWGRKPAKVFATS
jgi:hypothetical protein